MQRNKPIQHGSLILTNDPSITAWGWVVLTPDGVIYDAGCIKTAPEAKKHRIRKGDDTVRRISDINRKLLSLIREYKIKLILSELPHGSQTAAAAKMIGIVAGIAQTLSDTLDIPIEWYSEGDAKMATLNKRSCTKPEMVSRITHLYDVPWTTTQYIDEAIADAMAIYHVAKQQSPTLKILRNQ